MHLHSPSSVQIQCYSHHPTFAFLMPLATNSPTTALSLLQHLGADWWTMGVTCYVTLVGALVVAWAKTASLHLQESVQHTVSNHPNIVWPKHQLGLLFC